MTRTAGFFTRAAVTLATTAIALAGLVIAFDNATRALVL